MNARAIAFYLPQFHPIKENNLWWGDGFTEWTNSTKARPMFPTHYQPHLPGSLGFYDLRVPEIRQLQTEMAAKYGIEGFCYYHYWFAGRRLLEQPLAAVLMSKQSNFPFCICWANETWSGVWHGLHGQTLIEQTYPGIDDDEAHFNYLLRLFSDERYITVEGNPLILIYKPFDSPRISQTLQIWRLMAKQAGLSGLHIVAYSHTANDLELLNLGFDAVAQATGLKHYDCARLAHKPLHRAITTIQRRMGLPTIAPYRNLCKSLKFAWRQSEGYPVVINAWDNTPRAGARGVAYIGSTPEKYFSLLKSAIRLVQNRNLDKRIIFLKSWNEWAEGNHLEPDLRYGFLFLKALKAALID